MLENNLRAIDEDASRDEADYHNGTFREDRLQGRVKVLAEIQKKLGQYSECHSLPCCTSCMPSLFLLDLRGGDCYLCFAS